MRGADRQVYEGDLMFRLHGYMSVLWCFEMLMFRW